MKPSPTLLRPHNPLVVGAIPVWTPPHKRLWTPWRQSSTPMRPKTPDVGDAVVPTLHCFVLPQDSPMQLRPALRGLEWDQELRAQVWEQVREQVRERERELEVVPRRQLPPSPIRVLQPPARPVHSLALGGWALLVLLRQPFSPTERTARKPRFPASSFLKVTWISHSVNVLAWFFSFQKRS